MVRFSDMLGGNEEKQPAPDVPLPEVAETEVPETDEVPEAAESTSPEDLLDRLTQYATSARAADQVPAPEPARDPAPGNPDPKDSDPGSADDLSPVGDDFLPSAKRGKRRS